MHSQLRFAFFVDGSNLLGSLKKLGVQVQDYDSFYRFVLEQCFESWKKTFLDQGHASARLFRVYWYEVGTMDSWNLENDSAEQSLKDAFGRDDELKRSYMALAGQENPDLRQSEKYEKAWELCLVAINEWYEERQRALDGIKRFHHSVQSHTDFIEIVESGHWRLDMLNRKVDEKGVDTSLAVDMVTQIANYDVAILVSGDADMIPSLNYAKRAGKHVGVIDFIKGYPPENKGRQSSARLKVVADFVPQIYEMDLVRSGIGQRSSS